MIYEDDQADIISTHDEEYHFRINVSLLNDSSAAEPVERLIVFNKYRNRRIYAYTRHYSDIYNTDFELSHKPN